MAIVINLNDFKSINKIHGHFGQLHISHIKHHDGNRWKDDTIYECKFRISLENKDVNILLGDIFIVTKNLYFYRVTIQRVDYDRLYHRTKVRNITGEATFVRDFYLQYDDFLITTDECKRILNRIPTDNLTDDDLKSILTGLKI